MGTELQSCGHPVTCIVHTDEGTHYCEWCASLAAARRDVLKQSRIPAWIVWTTNTAGTVTMEAITTDNGRAVQYKRTLEASSRNYVIVKIEKTEINHLLGADMDELWQELYGGVASVQERVAHQRLELARNVSKADRIEVEHLWTIIKSAQAKIKELEQEQVKARAEERGRCDSALHKLIELQQCEESIDAIWDCIEAIRDMTDKEEIECGE